MTEEKMPKPTLSPDSCQNMVDVRAGVDATDAALVELLTRRFGYMKAAARIKADRDHVRDEARKAQVIRNACKMADESQLPVELIAQIWEYLVEGSIAYEFDRWDEVNAD